MNNTIIGSVNQVYKKLDGKVINLITKDNEPVDLDIHLKELTSNSYSDGHQHAFVKKGITGLPESLKREVEDLDFAHKMGFLQEINHIWISTGNSLFLWNYVDNTDIFRYDCSENVENVEAVKFKNQTLLIVSTKAYLYIHGVTCNHKELLKINSAVNIKSDGTIYSNFIVSKNGRPFMQGDDGHLYELNVAKVDRQNQPTYCYTICHTASPILKFLPYFFKSVPQVPVISMAMDKENELLFMLLKDSSIHSVNIQGSQYLPIQRAHATNLESIHYISPLESNVINLMAVSNKGDRLYYSAKGNNIDLIHTRSAPPLPGSLLFNSLTNETSDLSMYNFGIFATILSKSEKKYLVFTSANSIEDSASNRVLMEDVYSELLSEKVWSINEISSKLSLETHYFAEITVSPEVPSRELCTLSASGITHYVKQRPVDHLSEVISKNDPHSVLLFLKRFEAAESCALAFLLACSDQTSTGAAGFIHNIHLKEEGLLLYVSRIVKSIWNADVLQENIDEEEFRSVGFQLQKLYKLIVVENMEIDMAHFEFISRILDGIEFVCFIHYDLEWSKIRESLSTTSTGCKFSELITTEEGALLTRDIIVDAIKHSEPSTEASGYTYISDFLDKHCGDLLGDDNITYYRGIECLQAVPTEQKKENPLHLSLGYFSRIISLIQLDTLRLLCRQYCSLGYHIGGIQLVYLKYQTQELPESDIYSIIFACINDSLSTEKGLDYAKATIESALNLTTEESFHFKIYQWLVDNDQNKLLVIVESTSLERYIKTQLPLPESLACLRQYHEYRKEYYLALRDLVQLATEVDDISLEIRVGCLKKAISLVPQARDDISSAEETSLILSYKEAVIQHSIYKALLEDKDSEAKQAASELANSLKTADVLYHEYAYTHSLYEDALCLMDLMDLCDWNYAEKAWRNIIQGCKSEKVVREKLLDLAERLYPSIAAFPVYVIYKILHEQKSKLGKDFAKITLVEAGVPEEVILDAQAAVSEK